ncbi:MAG: hypothetical protein Ta2C_07290 [Candidatus Endomicrobiellum trichonymphae]|uniref:DUF6978 family protein n=1 Tax=Endomicrobium trichonymphae TaxID=1408204 RepID=UPI0027D421B6|nr:MAG: hypothetical protein Ta2C_07290 [Candidatus Endomicrobium trichonymphae]
MPEINLTQKEADRLIAVQKTIVPQVRRIDVPSPSQHIHIPVKSVDKKEEFIIDFSRKSIKIQKTTKQLRLREVVILLRLDINAAPHRNPDNTELENSHLHVYREGFSDKYAIDVPKDKFSDIDNLEQTFIDFLEYCNIEKIPPMQLSII